MRLTKLKKIVGRFSAVPILFSLLTLAFRPPVLLHAVNASPKAVVLTDEQESHPQESSPASAQGADPWKLFVGPDSRFGHILTDQGLSSPDVVAIAQDSQGFIWFGTLDGLDRYDGYQMKVFRNDPEDPNSLSSNAIRTLYVDRGGILWIGTWTGGLVRYDTATESFFNNRKVPQDPPSVYTHSIFCLYE